MQWSGPPSFVAAFTSEKGAVLYRLLRSLYIAKGEDKKTG